MRPSRLILLLLVATALGLAGLVYLASNRITLDQADESDAAREFLAARAAFGSAAPMLEVDTSGHVLRRTSPALEAAVPLERLHILVYQLAAQRLIRADVPFWFVRLKGPALRYAVRGTGVDLDRLGVTAADIERHGRGPILDETRGNGDRILAWVE